MVVIDRYIDNKRELDFEIALQELENELKPHIPTDEELDEMAQYYEYKANIGNTQKLIGAQ
jgi:hypothetical protein